MTDRETIRRGFGEELLSFSEFAFNNASVSDSYLETKREYYYTPDQIKEIMGKDR